MDMYMLNRYQLEMIRKNSFGDSDTGYVYVELYVEGLSK